VTVHDSFLEQIKPVVASTQGSGFPVRPATEPPAPAPAMPAAAPALPDPIAEAPNAVWYVRTNAGGQFGPARGDTMQQWLDERRVGPDYLVWREGWPEWKRASAVFARLAAISGTAPGGPGPSIPIAPAPAADDWVDAIIESHSHAAAMPRVRPKRRQNNNLLLVISIAVVVLGAILVVVVIIAATKKGGDDSPPAGGGSSSTTTALVPQCMRLVAGNQTHGDIECHPATS
jgi:hypothetical protein